MNDWLPDHDLVLKEYFVAVLDILGQSERLKSIRLPASKDDEAAIIPIVKDTYGLVHLFRRTFDQYFRQLPAAPKSLSTDPEFTREQASAFERARAFRVMHYGVGDSMYIGIPLDGPGQAAGVYGALFALAGVFLMFLSRSHVLRGAIDVGVASDVFPGELYGPAVESAYHLEKEVADYPRILIGERLLALLQRWEANPAQGVEARVAQGIAIACRELITGKTGTLPLFL